MDYFHDTLKERMNYVERSLQHKLDMLSQMDNIEYLSEILSEKEKKNTDSIHTRLLKIENAYIFHITHFTNFVNSVSKQVKDENVNKKYSYIMKKIGNMWKNLTTSQKVAYSFF